MKLCSHCNAQFSDEHSRCLHCNRRLRALREEAETSPQFISRLHHLADDHPAKIAPLLDRLRDAGVPFTLITDGGTSSVDRYRGSSGWEAKASVYVEPADRKLAETLHREFLEALIPHLADMASADTPPSDSCPGCHEPLPGNVDECPSCGLVFLEA